VAHEIRNPLTVIKMLFHSLNLQFPATDPRTRDVEVMRERIDHLNKSVEQILNFARTAEPELAPAPLNGVIEDLALLVRHKLKNHGIKFVLQLAPELPEVLADAAQLNQALLNLVLNAVEAMPRGGTLTIQTGRAAEKQLFVELKDTGTGMTPEQQAGAFRSLLQTTKKRGTGIGLAIVSKIIEAHHGTISVSSAPNSGTAFRILIPHQ